MNRIETIRFLHSNLKPVQKEIFHKFFHNTKRTTVFHCSRRLGKSYLLCVLSIIYAIKKPSSQIRYASTTQKSVRKIVHPIFKELFLSIPSRFRGKWNSQEGSYIFKNGSQIHVVGVGMGHVDDIRGTSCDLALIDEASFVDDLGYLIDSVLMPQLLTVPGSRLIMASSSPVSPSHKFVDYIQKAKIDDSYHSYTIYDGGYSEDLIAEFCKESGGEHSTAWRREYLNEIIVDEDYAIIPEFESMIVGIQKPDPSIFKYLHKYEAMDIGVKRDLTFVLFGYYDFQRAKLCIQAEYYVNGPRMTTPDLAKAIKDIRKELWNEKPYKSIADNNNLLLLQDLGLLHDCHFSPTGKDSLEAMVNEMRIWIKNQRIEIDSSCTVLIESIKYGFWNDSRTDWGRSSTLGHFDALAALMYLIRNVDQVTNPIPVVVGPDDFYLAGNDGQYSELKKAFNKR